jgi:hypothetical protein
MYGACGRLMRRRRWSCRQTKLFRSPPEDSLLLFHRKIFYGVYYCADGFEIIHIGRNRETLSFQYSTVKLPLAVSTEGRFHIAIRKSLDVREVLVSSKVTLSMVIRPSALSIPTTCTNRSSCPSL